MIIAKYLLVRIEQRKEGKYDVELLLIVGYFEYHSRQFSRGLFFTIPQISHAHAINIQRNACEKQ